MNEKLKQMECELLFIQIMDYISAETKAKAIAEISQKIRAYKNVLEKGIKQNEKRSI